jgi:arylsulfatase A-like enzyme
MGDNGTPAAANQSQPPHQHKGTVYEGGVHVPLIVCGAAVVAPGRTSDHLVHGVDLWATVQELLDVPVGPRPIVDSLSFAGVLGNPAAPAARSAVYVRHGSPNGPGPKDWLEHGAHDGRWWLLERTGVSPAFELFDLQADPQQLSNLWPPDPGLEQVAVDQLQAVIDASSGP